MLRISPSAVDDLERHWLALREFGELAADAFLNEIEGAFERLLEFPLSGHQRADLPRPFLVLNVRRRLLVYRYSPDDDVVEVVRVLGGRMNLADIDF